MSQNRRFEILCRRESDHEATHVAHVGDEDRARRIARGLVCSGGLRTQDHAWVFDHSKLTVPYAISRDFTGLRERTVAGGSWRPVRETESEEAAA